MDTDRLMVTRITKYAVIEGLTDDEIKGRIELLQEREYLPPALEREWVFLRSILAERATLANAEIASTTSLYMMLFGVFTLCDLSYNVMTEGMHWGALLSNVGLGIFLVIYLSKDLREGIRRALHPGQRQNAQPSRRLNPGPTRQAPPHIP